MNYTKNYKLVKPLSTERYNIASTFNQNADIIDEKIKELENVNNSQNQTFATKTQLSEMQDIINNEITRSTNKNTELLNNINSEINRAKESEKILESSINEKVENEKTRATGIEGFLLDTINENKPVWDNKYTREEVDNKFSTLETNIDWKESVATYDDIAITYPMPEDGWTVNVNDTDYTYRYNGTEWVAISANAIPKATNSIDGILSKEDHINYEDANSKKHTHQNKAVLDTINETTFSKWNTVDNKVDKEQGKGLSSNDYTTEEKTKLDNLQNYDDTILTEKITTIENNLLDTLEEIEANTESGKIAGALALKEFSNNLGGFTPVIDTATGQIIGYKTSVGADTVFPFNTGGGGIEKFKQIDSKVWAGTGTALVNFASKSFSVTQEHIDTHGNDYIFIVCSCGIINLSNNGIKNARVSNGEIVTSFNFRNYSSEYNFDDIIFIYFVTMDAPGKISISGRGSCTAKLLAIK